ncbi:MAG: hypothetical protein Q8P50_07200, partial [Bacillota bacterium]|nr:hypothetical protein [Bacillota bacterium]
SDGTVPTPRQGKMVARHRFRVWKDLDGHRGMSFVMQQSGGGLPMGRFKEQEKERYAVVKLQQQNLFTQAALAPGMYLSRHRDFCLPQDNAEQNLFLGIRADILQYFTNYGIKWHNGQNGKPSNHLCDSQVCCVNFLAPFASQPDALVTLLKPIYPDIVEAMPLEEDGCYVAFEWIGQRNYLNEMVRGKSKRTRGANFTSADAAARFRQKDGRIRTVLIEWKYTESYGGKDFAKDSSGPTRIAIYKPLYQKPGCPINQSKIGQFEDLFCEPFYQLMRQQFLAHEMELAKELDADRVSLLHLAPDANLDFKKVTSPSLQLKYPGKAATEVWADLVLEPDSFASRSVEGLFRPFPIARYPALRGWWDYIKERYPWVI